jgi:hypothetical protein
MICFFWFFILLLSDTPPTYSLNEQERDQWAEFGKNEQVQQQAITQVIQQAAQLRVEPGASMQVHAALKDALLQTEIIRARRDAFLAQLRADHACRDCVITDGQLVPPKK